MPCMDAEIREKRCVSVISRLNSNKELAAEFLEPSKQKKKSDRCLNKVNGNKQCIPHIYRG